MKENEHIEQKQDIEKIEEKIVDNKEEKKKEENNFDDILLNKDKKINELTDKYLRTLAELDNYRKRTIKEKQEFEKFLKIEIINIFLPILDNLERLKNVLKDLKNIDESLKTGIELIVKQFYDVLNDLGVKEIEAKGIFNPEFHHVLHKEHVEGKSDGEILEVYQKGYILDNRIIRPAMVKVSYIHEDKIKSEKTNKEKI